MKPFTCIADKARPAQRALSLTQQVVLGEHIRLRALAVLTALLLLSGCGGTQEVTPLAVASPTPPPIPSPLPTVTSLPAASPTPIPPTAVPPPTLTPAPSPTDPTPASPPARPVRTVQPAVIEGYIPNPYMGWQDTQRPNPRFPETVGYIRVDWRNLNPAEGVYDWGLIETLRQQMLAVGGQISFRVRTSRPPPWGEGNVTPQWLLDQGVQVFYGSGGSEPVYSDCRFLDAHARFIDAMRQKYDGDPDVAFIDIGSYGYYAEWNSDQYDLTPGSLDWHARRRILDMYLGGQATRPCTQPDGQVIQVTYSYTGFQRTQLIMPYTPWFQDSTLYALERRQDVGLRHDALGSEGHQRYYRQQIGSLVQQIWTRVPIVFELDSEAYTPEALASARDFAREMHASFVHDNLSGQGDNTLIEDLLENVGYRLVLREMTYTSELAAGEALSFRMVWENTGVAPPYVTYPLVLLLTDAQGAVRSSYTVEADIRTWLPGSPIVLEGSMPLPSGLRAGAYDLRLAFVDPAGGQPILTLAIEGRDAQGRYLIGAVQVR
jgi:hypothetical protein